LINTFPNIPANSDIKTDDITLKAVKIPPKTPYVTNIESTPVTGVAIKNDKTDAELAPLFFRETPIGITEQEHIGRGMPNKTLFITDDDLALPRCFLIKSSGSRYLTTPAINSPIII